MKVLTAEEQTAVRENLFERVRDRLLALPGFPWHRDTSGTVTACRPHSSQALAIDLFGTVQSLRNPGAVVDAWSSLLRIPSVASPSITLERLIEKELLGESRSTQIDAAIEGKKAFAFFECKFTESDGGGCNQIKPLGSPGANRGKVQCNGDYAGRQIRSMAGDPAAH